ncbi:response regulator transcription factor [Pseudoruegeria sp. SHC-113]|uniref:response regulator transcription factor n=1 Tax=Pseudoruegeria sp. SHC-113 TaxID=2855439 RepID=UPI0021BB6661|nr:response regulator transcription factor [Pseudoruegeria sp. SHC-113]MCT8159744.1 response regulator transcription factor [Pseudoruegeria sp. SHC-113]
MKVLVADDHDLVLDMMRMLLTSEPDVEVETAGDLDGAIAVMEADAGFDLVLLDFNMPGMDGLDGLARALAAGGGSPVALMSGVASRAVAQAALDAGAAGFLPKTMTAKSLMNAARFMASGEKYAPVDFMTSEPVDGEGLPTVAQELTPREMEVLGGVCRGLSNKEIALELDLQEVTIKLHMKTLCRKLDARNRTHAAMIARTAGLF